MTYRCKPVQAHKVWHPRGNNSFPLPDGQYPPGLPGLEETPAAWIHLSDYAGVRDDGTLWVWGWLSEQIWRMSGNAAFPPGTPVQIGTDTDWVECKSNTNNGNFVLARKEDTTLWSVGSNSGGQLGIGLYCIDESGTNPYGWRLKLSSSIESISPRPIEEYTRRYTKKPEIQIQSRVAIAGWPVDIESVGQRLNNEPGEGAVARVDWRGRVAEVVVTSGGSGYTSRPTVVVRSATDSETENLGGATATVTKMSLVNVESFETLGGGSGYTEASAVETLTGATATGVIRGSVTGVAVTGGGFGYTSAPNVAVSSSNNDPRENSAGATASVTQMSLANIASFAPLPLLYGFGYTWATATERLTGATAAGVIVDGAVVGWSLLEPGASVIDPLNQAPLDVFVSGDGIGASARAIVAGSSILAIEMIFNPECWESPPTFEIAGGGGVGATAAAVSLIGHVDRWELTGHGSSTADILDQSTLNVQVAGDGQEATARAILAGGSVEEISMDSNPECWESAPTIEITGGGGSGAVAEVPRIEGFVQDKLVLVSGGAGYTQGKLVPGFHAARLHVVAIPHPDETDQQLFDDPDGNVVADVVLTPGGVVSVEIKEDALLNDEQLTWNADGYLRGSQHRVAGDGVVKPFSMTFTLPFQVAAPDLCDVVMLGPGDREVSLRRDGSLFSLDETAGGHPHPPALIAKYADDNPDGRTSLESYTSPTTGAEFEAVDGFLHLKTAAPNTPVEQFPPLPPPTAPYKCRVIGSPPSWVGPSIDQATFFSAPSGSCDDPFFAVAERPKSYGNGYVGVGDADIQSHGSGYREEPIPDVWTNFYATPVQISGAYDSFSCYDGSCFAVDQSGKLHWWGDETADSGLGANYWTASPTPVGRGAFPNDSDGGASRVACVEANRAYFTMPEHSNRLAIFAGTRFEPFFPKFYDERRTANNLWFPLEPNHQGAQPGLGYESEPTLKFMACGDPVYSASTKLVGPESYEKVQGCCARTSDGIWYGLLGDGVGGENAFEHVRAYATYNREWYPDADEFSVPFDSDFWNYIGYWTRIDEKISKSYLVYAADPDGPYASGESAFTISGLLNFYVDIGYEDDVMWGSERAEVFVPEALDDIVTLNEAVVRSYSPPTAADNIRVIELPDMTCLPFAAVTDYDSLISFPAGSSFITCPTAGGPIRRHGWILSGVTRPDIARLSSLNGNLARTDEAGQLLSILNTGVWPSPVRPLSLKVTDHGSGYDSPAIAEVTPASPEASFNVEWSGKLVGIGVVDGGSGYRTPPEVTGVTGAACQIAGPVDYVEVTDQGSGYRSPPDVVFSRPGIPATAMVTVVDGKVVSVSVADGGRYRQAPDVSFVPVTDVDRIDVSDAGGGFTSRPDVFIGGGGGSDATATCRVWGGVQEITVLNQGRNYTSPPQVTLVNHGEDGFSEATATATIDSLGRVTAVAVTNAGDNYTAPPSVVFTGGGGNGASAGVVMNYRIRDVSVTNHGHHYVESPRVVFLGGGGGTAAATATLDAPGQGATATATIDGEVVCVSLSEAAADSDYALPPIVDCVRNEDAPEGATDAKLKSRIAGLVTGITPSNSAGVYLQAPFDTPEWNAPASNPDDRGRKPSNVFLVGSSLTGGYFHRGGVGVVEDAEGGPISEVVLDSSLSSKRFYHKPLAVPACRVNVETTTCLKLAGVIPEKLSNVNYVATGRICSEISRDLRSANIVPDIVSCVGSLSSISAEAIRPGLGRYYSESPVAMIEDDAGGTGEASVAFTGFHGVEFTISTQSGQFSFRASPYLRGGKPLVWSAAATATAEVAGGSVTRINVTNGAVGYTRPPRVFLVGGGGDGAVAGEPVMSSDTSIVSIPLLSAGAGYESPPDVVIIDSEVPADRDPELLEFFGYKEHFKVGLQNWSIEYAKFVQPRQISQSNFRVINSPGWLFDGHLFHPLYDDSGYVESMRARQYVYPGEFNVTIGTNPYPAGSTPLVTVYSTGHAETEATATATPYNYSEVYGERVRAMPLSPSRESYS